MMRRIKLVASVLMLALAASPLLAAIPCQQAAQTKAQCGPDCPMMAKLSRDNAKNTQETGSNSATPTCCQRAPHPTAPVTTQAGPERPLSLALLSSSAISLAVVPDRSEASVPVLTSLCVATRSQASLCTFLI